MTDLPSSVDATHDLLTAQDYVADRALATTLYLALSLGRPVFLEGEAGVGKTEIAKVVAGPRSQADPSAMLRRIGRGQRRL